MAEKVATWGVDIDRHVGLAPTQGAAASDSGDVLAEYLGVEAVAEGEEGGEQLEMVVGEAIEVREVARLVDLVDVGLLGSEREVLLDLCANFAEELRLKKVMDDAVFIPARSI